MSRILILLLFLSEPALAIDQLEGRFKGRGEGKLDMQVFAFNEDPGNKDYFVMLDTAVQNECTGGLRGVAQRVTATSLRLRKVEPGGDAQCEVSLRYDPSFRRITTEEKNCAYWHGASCNFEGTLSRR